MKKTRVPSVKEIRTKNPFKHKYDPFLHPIGYLAPYVVKGLLYTPVTANQVSLFADILYLLIAFLIGLNKGFIMALVLLQLMILMDCVDGRLARMRNTKTFLGIYYEYTFHETGPPLIFFALGSYLFHTMNNPLFLYFGALIVISQLITNSFGTAKQRIMYRHIKKTNKIPRVLVDGGSMIKDAKTTLTSNIILGLNLLPNLDVLWYVFILGYLFGVLEYILGFYLIYFAAIAVFKSARELLIGFKPFGLK
jgi:phosphatidylglycerophosphate synthase